MSRTEAMRELLARWRLSDLSLMAFGRQEGVHYKKLLYWKKKFASERRARSSSAQARECSELVPITVAPDATAPANSSTTPFDIRLTSGVCIAVVPGFDEIELRRLVQVLQAC